LLLCKDFLTYDADEDETVERLNYADGGFPEYGNGKNEYFDIWISINIISLAILFLFLARDTSKAMRLEWTYDIEDDETKEIKKNVPAEYIYARRAADDVSTWQKEELAATNAKAADSSFIKKCLRKCCAKPFEWMHKIEELKNVVEDEVYEDYKPLMHWGAGSRLFFDIVEIKDDSKMPNPCHCNNCEGKAGDCCARCCQPSLLPQAGPKVVKLEPCVNYDAGNLLGKIRKGKIVKVHPFQSSVLSWLFYIVSVVWVLDLLIRLQRATLQGCSNLLHCCFCCKKKEWQEAETTKSDHDDNSKPIDTETNQEESPPARRKTFCQAFLEPEKEVAPEKSGVDFILKRYSRRRLGEWLLGPWCGTFFRAVCPPIAPLFEPLGIVRKFAAAIFSGIIIARNLTKDNFESAGVCKNGKVEYDNLDNYDDWWDDAEWRQNAEDRWLWICKEGQQGDEFIVVLGIVLIAWFGFTFLVLPHAAMLDNILDLVLQGTGVLQFFLAYGQTDGNLQSFLIIFQMVIIVVGLGVAAFEIFDKADTIMRVAHYLGIIKEKPESESAVKATAEIELGVKTVEVEGSVDSELETSVTTTIAHKVDLEAIEFPVEVDESSDGTDVLEEENIPIEIEAPDGAAEEEQADGATEATEATATVAVEDASQGGSEEKGRAQAVVSVQENSI
jgi:hypothetical protein